MSILLPAHIKLSIEQSLSNEDEMSNMAQVLYAFALKSLMYAMVCTRPDLAHVIGTINRFNQIQAENIGT